MNEQRREEAIKYIMSQLEDGYIDLGLHDQDELEIIKEAMNMLRIVDKWNSIPEEYIIPIEDWKKLGYTDEEAKELAEASNIFA